jgi:GNAT superfamily N-acetyltransferase
VSRLASDTISIRPATEGDIPLLRALADRIWHACYPGMITEEQIRYMLGWMYAPERIAGEMRRGVRWAVVVHLHKLYLDLAWQGRGVGQRMLQHVSEHAQGEGARSIELRVNKGNARALAAYARAGFRIERSLVADIGGGFVMDDHVLRLDLPQR